MDHGRFIYDCDDLRLAQIVSGTRIYYRGVCTGPHDFHELASDGLKLDQ